MNIEGGCNCRAVRFRAEGEPIRTGLCHCLTCRKETGSAFMAFAVWDRSNVTVIGETRRWTSTTDHRHFCPSCGSSLFATDDERAEVEIRIGALDHAPSGFKPDYELWVPRREDWLPPLTGAVQHQRNRR